MPHRYFYDSVVTKETRGKTTTDTIWHRVRNLQFVNQLGKKTSLDDLKGKIVVVDFFFTRCPSICPVLARRMKKLQDSFTANDTIVQFLSISIDPEHDSVPQLRKFADRYNINHDTWWMVSGDKKDVYDFAFQELKASVADPGIDTAFIHTENFFLLDTNRIVRGWYSGFDTVKQAQLVRDIPLLMLEKDKKSPSIFREFIPLLPVIFLGIALALGLLYLGWIRLFDWDQDRQWLPFLGLFVLSVVMGGSVCINALSFDAMRVRAALDTGQRLWHLLVIKNLALLCLVAPIGFVISLLIAIGAGDWSRFVNALVLTVCFILLWLGVGNIVSIAVPSRDEPLLKRKQSGSLKQFLIAFAVSYLIGYLDIAITSLRAIRFDTKCEQLIIF